MRQCHGNLRHRNVTGIHVKALVITNTAQGTTKTLPNPTFPCLYKASGTDLEIKLCFEYSYSGNLEMPSAERRIRFDDSKTAAMDIRGICNAYDIYLKNEGAPEDAY